MNLLTDLPLKNCPVFRGQITSSARGSFLFSLPRPWVAAEGGGFEEIFDFITSVMIR